MFPWVEVHTGNPGRQAPEPELSIKEQGSSNKGLAHNGRDLKQKTMGKFYTKAAKEAKGEILNFVNLAFFV